MTTHQFPFVPALSFIVVGLPFKVIRLPEDA
jgi:hypothetical protein